MNIQLQTPLRYDNKSIWLHWITAVLVVLLWCVGQTIDWFPRGTPRVTMRSLHIVFGVVLGCVLFYRIWWRSTAGRRLPPAETGALQILSTLVQLLLYAAMLAAVIAGMANAWVRGDAIFNLFTIPKLDPGNKELRETVEEIHELLAHSVLILAALHTAAALIHHFAWKDDVLRRMLTSK